MTGDPRRWGLALLIFRAFGVFRGPLPERLSLNPESPGFLPCIPRVPWAKSGLFRIWCVWSFELEERRASNPERFAHGTHGGRIQWRVTASLWSIRSIRVIPDQTSGSTN